MDFWCILMRYAIDMFYGWHKIELLLKLWTKTDFSVTFKYMFLTKLDVFNRLARFLMSDTVIFGYKTNKIVLHRPNFAHANFSICPNFC